MRLVHVALPLGSNHVVQVSRNSTTSLSPLGFHFLGGGQLTFDFIGTMIMWKNKVNIVLHCLQTLTSTFF